MKFKWQCFQFYHLYYQLRGFGQIGWLSQSVIWHCSLLIDRRRGFRWASNYLCHIVCCTSLKEYVCMMILLYWRVAISFEILKCLIFHSFLTFKNHGGLTRGCCLIRGVYWFIKCKPLQNWCTLTRISMYIAQDMSLNSMLDPKLHRNVFNVVWACKVKISDRFAKGGIGC